MYKFERCLGFWNIFGIGWVFLELFREALEFVLNFLGFLDSFCHFKKFEFSFSEEATEDSSFNNNNNHITFFDQLYCFHPMVIFRNLKKKISFRLWHYACGYILSGKKCRGKVTKILRVWRNFSPAKNFPDILSPDRNFYPKFDAPTKKLIQIFTPWITEISALNAVLQDLKKGYEGNKFIWTI